MSAISPEQPASALLLADVLDLRAAAPLAAELTVLRGQKVEVDASRVHRLGGQCLQVLLSARSFWNDEGIPFRVVTPSQDFMDGLALMGASSLLLSLEA